MRKEYDIKTKISKPLTAFVRGLLDTDLRLDAACISHTGCRRRKNEDNFCFDDKCLPIQHGSMNTPMLMNCILQNAERLGVFDGMGGGDCGEDASFEAASLLTGEPYDHLTDQGQVEPYLIQLCRRMNQCVHNRQLENMCGRMGSTAAMIYFWDESVYVCNVGDSPVFLMRQGLLEKVSQDHTDREQMEACGITGRKPYLTQFLGMDPEEYVVTPSISRYTLNRGDTLLLCSDGVTDLISRQEIEYLFLQEDDSRRRVEQLLAQALQRGGVDNITIIVCQIY